MKTKYLLWERAVRIVLLVLLLSAVGMTKTNAQTQGALNGVFSVSDNTQICFSQGNLQYQASTNTWQFAEHQWDYIGNDNNNISQTYSGWIDLFGWGTSGYNHGAVCYQPWSTCEGNNEYYAYGSYNYNLYDQTGQADWGYNAISNGGNSVGQWKTLSLPEWNYLLFERPTVSNIRYVKGKLNYVKGLILLPDNWNETVYSLNNDLYSYDYNNINTTDWENLLEPNGAVFLPAAGARLFYEGYDPWDDLKNDGGGTWGGDGYWAYYNYNGSDGYYWTTSSANEDEVNGLTFSNYGQANEVNVQRQDGYSVRLVHVTQATSYYISTPVNLNYGGTVLGAGFYEPNDTCILTAIPNENYTFYYWKEGEEIVSTDSIYSFPVTRNRQVMAVFANSNNGPLAYIDLGLPSGLLWATCNVGAYSPEDFGNYYAWGEIEPKDTYNWSTYQYGNDWNKLTKYCTQYSYGYNNFTDNLTTLLPEDDAATTNWGAGWHTPTKDEWIELFANTTSIWTTQNGVRGFLFSASNGNSLFLPACGYREYGVNFYGNECYYWSSSLKINGPNDAWGFHNGMGDHLRCYGECVRAVRSSSQSFVNAIANPTEGGTVTGAGTYEPNETCTLTATPSPGFLFENWTNEGVVVSDSTTYSFTVTEDVTFVANFTRTNPASTDYISDGLIMYLDGIYNTRNGHDATATVWEDLIGNYDLIVSNYNFYTWEDNHFFGVGNGGYLNTGKTWKYFNSLNDDITIEIVTYIDCDKTSPLYRGLAGWHINSDGTNFQNDQGGGRMETLGRLPVSEADNTISTVSYTRTNGSFLNGVWKTNDNNIQYGVNSEKIVVFGNSYLQQRGWNDSIYCIRMYNRSLTPEEVAYNHSIDVTRFNAGTNYSLFEIAAIANPTNGGTVSGSGTFEEGGICTLVATPNEGYTFVNWTENGEVVSTDSTYSFTVTGDRNLVANFDIIYFFSTYVDEDIYPMNTSIPIHGTVTDFENNPVANMEVEIGITVMNWKRTLQAFTDENGQFTATFEPLPLESGYYTVNSGPVGNNSTEIHDSFDILGMTIVENTLNDELEVVNSQWLLCDVIQNIPKTGHVQIINKNNLALTNIQVTVLSAPAGCEISFVPMDLAGLSSGYLTYTVLGTIPTQGYEYQQIRLKVTCDQGAEAIFIMWYYCEEAHGNLVVTSGMLNNLELTTTATRGKSKIIDLMLTNYGMAATGRISINLPPDLDWMSMVGSTTMASISANNSATFSLRLSPDDDTPLGLYTGNIVINCANAPSVVVHYTITVVSEEEGALVVDVIDEYTTNTNNGDGPHVEGAEVTLTDYYSHETVAQGYTDSEGIFSVENIPEGYYLLDVVAERHESRLNKTIYITAGETNMQVILLHYLAVRPYWHVESTGIQDVYNIVLNIDYEVNVPVPVVVIDAPQLIPVFDDSYTFNYVIENHGLIDSYNLTLYPPENDYFQFTVLYDHIDTLHAQSTVEIPCEVTRKSNDTIECAEWGLSKVRYSYLSGSALKHDQAFTYTKLGGSNSCDQNLPSLSGGSGSGGGGMDIGISGGGSGLIQLGHGAPTHPGPNNNGYASGDFSTPEIEYQIDTIPVPIGIQFSQKLTMTREAFIGTFRVHNEHETNATTGIGINLTIKDEQGVDRTNLFQINIISMDGITAIDGTGTLDASSFATVKIQFVPTKQAAPTEPIVYSFGGIFTYVDPWNSVTQTLNLKPEAKLTVHPSPDLHIDYFIAKDVYGDNPFTEEVEPSLPAELAVRIWNRGAGTANNVTLNTVEPVIVENESGLSVGFKLMDTIYLNGVASPSHGLHDIEFGDIQSNEIMIGEWLFTSSKLAHLVSYNAQVVHCNLYNTPMPSLISYVGIHELTHSIRTSDTRFNGINDFLVNDIPDENNYPDSIFFSDGRRTSVDFVESIAFDKYVTSHDTIVSLTVNPSRIGWNYGETEDPGRNRYQLVSCIRNNDNQVIPLSNVWQEAVILHTGDYANDSVYENKLRIVDTVSVVQTYTYTLVFAGKPSDPYIFFGDDDEYWSNAANWEAYILPQANGNVLIDGTCLLDEDATVSSLTIVEGNSLTIPDDQILTVSNSLTNTTVSGLIIEDGGQLIHGNSGTQATLQKAITPYTPGTKDGWHLIASPLSTNVAVTSVANMLANNYDLYYYDEPTVYWINQEDVTNNFTDLENSKGYLYANSQEINLEFVGELENGLATVNVPLVYTTGHALQGFNLVGNPFAHNITSYASENVANGCYVMNAAKDDLIVSEISEVNPLKPAEGFFVKATAASASITFNPQRNDANAQNGIICLELSESDKLIDRLLVKTAEGQPLEKFSLNERRTKLFAQGERQELAIVTCEGNEQAVNFKAAKNGQYTINVNSDDMEFNYLHLIDNLTSADVDLLAEPSYTFEAKTSDYASRFLLRFIPKDSAADNSETFAFISNGNIIIIDEDANSTLQIIDMTGRVVISTDVVRDVSTNGMVSGVYVLRLINGDNVKTQKIVVR